MLNGKSKRIKVEGERQNAEEEKGLVKLDSERGESG
jgi:hypothetical protein